MTAPLRPRLVDAGLGRHADALLAQALPCVRLAVADVAERDWLVGTSKLGGMPDLPPDAPWPEWRGAPLAFVGQLDLVALRGLAAARELPGAGMLSFFYHAEQDAWGFDPADEGSFRVLYHRDPTALVRVTAPDAVPEYARFRAGRLTMREDLSLPPPSALGVRALGLDAEEDEAYTALWDELQAAEGEGLRHQLLGHPSPVQDEMQLECQLVTNGVYCGDPSGYEDPRRAALERGALDWRLLLQVDSDERLGMMWGDVGLLYFWMRQTDLAARDFERAWMILQCS